MARQSNVQNTFISFWILNFIKIGQERFILIKLTHILLIPMSLVYKHPFYREFSIIINRPIIVITIHKIIYIYIFLLPRETELCPLLCLLCYGNSLLSSERKRSHSSDISVKFTAISYHNILKYPLVGVMQCETPVLLACSPNFLLVWDVNQ